ncbi:unnamed protein product [Polarella glacialis]|uniref:AAA+ ATPase domain-containing protein n=1 Tax=Polarella glacialis TaxID=89957 RepID=A0A813FG59_POLGL|nr:unnamed protein product [Polarella glacialis]
MARAPPRSVICLRGPPKDKDRFAVDFDQDERRDAVVLVDRASTSADGSPLRITLSRDMMAQLHSIYRFVSKLSYITGVHDAAALLVDAGGTVELGNGQLSVAIRPTLQVHFVGDIIQVWGFTLSLSSCLRDPSFFQSGLGYNKSTSSVKVWLTRFIEERMKSSACSASAVCLDMLRVGCGGRGYRQGWPRELRFRGRIPAARRHLVLGCLEAGDLDEVEQLRKLVLEHQDLAGNLLLHSQQSGTFAELWLPMNSVLLALSARVSRRSVLFGPISPMQHVETVAVGQGEMAVVQKKDTNHECTVTTRVIATNKLPSMCCEETNIDDDADNIDVVFGTPSRCSGIYLTLNVKTEALADDANHEPRSPLPWLRDPTALTYTFVAVVEAEKIQSWIDAWSRICRLAVVARPLARLVKDGAAFELVEVAVSPGKPESGGKRGGSKGHFRARRWHYLEELVKSHDALGCDVMLHCMHACIMFGTTAYHFKCDPPNRFLEFLADAALPPQKRCNRTSIAFFGLGCGGTQRQNVAEASVRQDSADSGYQSAAGVQVSASSRARKLSSLFVRSLKPDRDYLERCSRPPWDFDEGEDYETAMQNLQMPTVDQFKKNRPSSRVLLWHCVRKHPEGVSARGRDGSTTLHLAARLGQPKLVRHLVARRADVNAVTDSGRTPLHVALLGKDVRIACLLVGLKADASDQDSQALMEEILLDPNNNNINNDNSNNNNSNNITLKDALVNGKWPSARPSGKSRGKGTGPVECPPFAVQPCCIRVLQKQPSLLSCWAQRLFLAPIPLQLRPLGLATADLQIESRALQVTPGATAADVLRPLRQVDEELPRLLVQGRLVDAAAPLAHALDLPNRAPLHQPLEVVMVDASTAAVLEVLPRRIALALGERLSKLGTSADLQELRLPLDRPPQLLLLGAEQLDQLQMRGATAGELQEICNDARISAWTSDQRAGLVGTLHRLTREVSRDQETTLLLVVRFGRQVLGCCEPIVDLVRSFKSTLLVGPPGLGKTTLLREYARMLSDLYGRRVVVIDTSMEIGGVAKVPHRCIGEKTDRLEVPSREQQFEVMVRAVQNLNPQAMVIDEIGTAQEVAAAASIAARGIQLVATAHAESLEAVLRSPCLQPLVGDIQVHTVGDVTAKLNNAGMKTKRERKHLPVFESLVELRGPDEWVLHSDLKASVDLVLAGMQAGRCLSCPKGPRSGGEARVGDNQATSDSSDEDSSAVDRHVISGTYVDSWDNSTIEIMHDSQGQALYAKWGGETSDGSIVGDTVTLWNWDRTGQVVGGVITWQSGCTWTRLGLADSPQTASRIARQANASTSDAQRQAATLDDVARKLMTHPSLNDPAVQHLIAAGAAYVLRFDGGVDAPTDSQAGPGGGGATFSRVRAGSKMGRPRRERPEQGSWQVFIPQTTVDLSELGGLMAGLAGLKEMLRSAGPLAPAMRLLVLQGDSKFIVDKMQRPDHQESADIFAQSCKPLLRLASDSLQDLKASIPSLLVVFQWAPRKVNRRADRLTHEARQDRKSTVQLPKNVMELLTHPLASPGEAADRGRHSNTNNNSNRNKNSNNNKNNNGSSSSNNNNDVAAAATTAAASATTTTTTTTTAAAARQKESEAQESEARRSCLDEYRQRQEEQVALKRELRRDNWMPEAEQELRRSLESRRKQEEEAKQQQDEEAARQRESETRRKRAEEDKQRQEEEVARQKESEARREWVEAGQAEAGRAGRAGRELDARRKQQEKAKKQDEEVARQKESEARRKRVALQRELHATAEHFALLRRNRQEEAQQRVEEAKKAKKQDYSGRNRRQD